MGFWCSSFGELLNIVAALIYDKEKQETYFEEQEKLQLVYLLKSSLWKIWQNTPLYTSRPTLENK